MDLPELRSFLGVEDNAHKFASCSNKVGIAFNAALDSSGKTWLYVFLAGDGVSHVLIAEPTSQLPFRPSGTRN
jgi:hypothetical protein